MCNEENHYAKNVYRKVSQAIRVIKLTHLHIMTLNINQSNLTANFFT